MPALAGRSRTAADSVAELASNACRPCARHQVGMGLVAAATSRLNRFLGPGLVACAPTGLPTRVSVPAPGQSAGMCLVAAGHPFDLIKVRLQTQVTMAGKAPEFTGAFDAARKIMAREGVSRGDGLRTRLRLELAKGALAAPKLRPDLPIHSFRTNTWFHKAFQGRAPAILWLPPDEKLVCVRRLRACTLSPRRPLQPAMLAASDYGVPADSWSLPRHLGSNGWHHSHLRHLLLGL